MKYLKSFFINIVILCWLSNSVNAQEAENSYDYWKNYKIVNELPVHSTMQYVIASNRYFDTGNYSIVKRGTDPNRHLTYFVVSRIGDSCYLKPFKSLESAMKLLPANRDILVFVNGHGKDFERNLGRGFLLDERYNLNVLLFEWPTDNRTLSQTARNARKVTPNFIRFIKELDLIRKTDFADSHLSVIFHSMGNQIARNVARSQENKTLNNEIFDNLILNAAALSHVWHACWVEKLKLQKRIYINSNKGDYPLHGVWFLRKTKPLGMTSGRNTAKNAVYVDFSLVAGDAHNYYTGKSELEKNNQHPYNYFNTLFHGLAVDTSNTLVFKKKENRTGFLIY